MTGPEVLGLSVQTPLMAPSLKVFWQVAPMNGQRFCALACAACAEGSAGAYPKNSTILLANGSLAQALRFAFAHDTTSAMQSRVFRQVLADLLADGLRHDHGHRIAHLNILGYA